MPASHPYSWEQAYIAALEENVRLKVPKRIDTANKLMRQRLSQLGAAPGNRAEWKAIAAGLLFLQVRPQATRCKRLGCFRRPPSWPVLSY